MKETALVYIEPLNRENGGCVSIEYLVLGPIENNVYILSDGESTVVVDPSCESESILKALGERKVDAIFITHWHWDHVGAAALLRKATGAPVIASEIDAAYITGERKSDAMSRPTMPCEVDVAVSDGDVVTVGDMKWRVIATPGHTKGGICFFLDGEHSSDSQAECELNCHDECESNHQAECESKQHDECESNQHDECGSGQKARPVLVAGDTLFFGSIGRTDFEGGSMDDMRSSLKRLAELPDETIVLPGHGSLTSIGAERDRVFARFA